MAQVILFQEANYHGAHAHVFFAEPNFHQGVSSLVVIEGNWAFYVDPNFQTPNPQVFGPGLYPDLSLYPNLPAGIKNMSSLQPVDAEPTVVADVPANSHVILFENAKYHGNHKHVFFRNNDLRVGSEFHMDNQVSSLVVLEGNWAFYADPNYENQYPPILGPGLYPNLPAGIKNDDMSSLQLVNAPPTVSAPPVDSEIIPFIDAHYHGNHKHVFHEEDNLGADDDNGFNDAVSSFHILSGLWVFYSDWHFQNPYADGRQYGPAIDGSWVEAIGIKNDDMSSLRSVQ